MRFQFRGHFSGNLLDTLAIAKPGRHTEMPDINDLEPHLVMLTGSDTPRTLDRMVGAGRWTHYRDAGDLLVRRRDEWLKRYPAAKAQADRRALALGEVKARNGTPWSDARVFLYSNSIARAPESSQFEGKRLVLIGLSSV